MPTSPRSRRKPRSNLEMRHCEARASAPKQSPPTNHVWQRLLRFARNDAEGRFTMTRTVLSAAFLAATLVAANAQSADKSVIRLDPALDALVSPDAKLELVRGDFGFTEGTTWVP